MNWKQIYIDLINKARQENRKRSSEYYELHHIFPDFMFRDRSREGRAKGHLPGTPNSKKNLVLLTHREHILAHLILYKIYKDSRYGHQCLTSILLMTGGRAGIDHNEGRRKFGELIKKTKLYKNIREKARKSLSEDKKGKMIAKCSLTGKRIGWVETSHPMVQSGEWVHHSKGRMMSEDEKQSRKPSVTGKNNARYSGKSDDFYIESYVEVCKLANRSVPFIIWQRYCDKFKIEYLKSVSDYRKGIVEKMYAKGQEVTGVPFIYEEWYLVNKKGNELFHDISRKICLK